MKKILSISIAAYNASKTLDDVLKPFLLDNVLDRVEVIIVNDGSKDNTLQIAQQYNDLYPNTFRVISKKNGGWGSTVNTGIAAASGKYFKLLDGDDYFSFENLSKFLDYLEQSNADIVHTPFVTFSDNGGYILNVLNDFRWQSYTDFPKNTELPISEFPFFSPEMHNLTIKTAILQKNHINITENCFYTDVEYSLKAFNICKTIAFYELPIYFYRLAFRGQSMGLNGIRRHYLDNQKMLIGMLEYYSENVSEIEKKSVFFRRLLSVCELMYRMYLALECTGSQKKQLIEFDSYLKEHYFDFYNKVRSKPIALLRKTNFRGYWLVGHYKMYKDRRLKINFFEGE